MRRRSLLLSLGSAAAWPLGVRAQQRGRPFRIGVLVHTRIERALPFWRPFQEELGRLGYKEEIDYLLLFAQADGRRERYPEIAADLVRRKVDVIVAPGSDIAAAAKWATGEIPIVVLGGDLVEFGLIASYARPGSNVTGIDMGDANIFVKQLEWLKRIAPKISRAATLGLRGHPLGLRAVAMAQRAAGSLGIELRDIWIERIDEVERAFDDMARRRIEAVAISAHSIFHVEYERVARVALRHRIAASFYHTRGAEVGGLLAYDTDSENLTRRAAVYVDKILKGASPAGLPVEFATHFKLTINLRTAKALGIEIPETILNLADKVIE